MKVEYVYTGALIAAFAAIVWLSVYVIFRLFQGQR